MSIFKPSHTTKFGPLDNTTKEVVITQ